jgi:fatty-acyl-CoA synthase
MAVGIAAQLRREWRYLRGLARTLIRILSISARSKNLICDDLEAAVDRWRTRPAISFEGGHMSYGELDATANRFSHWVQTLGIARGESVALFAPNRLEYLAIWYGLSKVGVVTALINNQLTGEMLAHCLNISGARHCIVDDETAPAFTAVAPLLDHSMQEWTLGEARGSQQDLGKLASDQSEQRPSPAARRGLTAGDTALLIYTSGTTGPPKAARITHMRAQLYMRAFSGATGARPDDRLYLTLPLYHATGGLCGMGAALLSGGSVALKRNFSASHFWSDVAAEGATLFVYVGELWRYLASQPPSSVERGHKLRLAFGNGLGADIWATIESRFGVPRILEFYGSTEGNVSMFNFDGTVGAVGRVAPYLSRLFNIALARFDIETESPVRGSDGLCTSPAPSETGECLGQIRGNARASFTGYVDESATGKKVLHNVFKRGDHWFATGDLMRRDKAGYFYFVDRVGDTFRWQGENVSTGEVSEQLLASPGVKEAVVYGVRVGNLEGRAGMAALVVDETFDLARFGAFVDRVLPVFARPVFLRLAPSIETTGTFKYRKLDLVADGFDPAKARGALFFRHQHSDFTPLTPQLYSAVASGSVKL